MRVHIEYRRGNRGDEERAESIDDVDAVVPQMRFAHKRRGKPYARLTADGKGCLVVWMDVVGE